MRTLPSSLQRRKEGEKRKEGRRKLFQCPLSVPERGREEGRGKGEEKGGGAYYITFEPVTGTRSIGSSTAK